jgi:ELWxxDGT repeat protein
MIFLQSFRSWWQQHQQRRPSRALPGARRLCLEILEDRLVPSSATLLQDINPSGPGSRPYDFTSVGSVTFFGANDGLHGVELWKTNGTSAGTVLVQDIDPGPTGSNLGYLTNVNGTLYFSANDGTHGDELWKSNGTSAGTVLVQDIYPGSQSSNPSDLTNVNGTLYFSANDATNGDELWKSNGRATALPPARSSSRTSTPVPPVRIPPT